MTISVGVIGARGAMGSAVCAAVDGADGLALVAEVNRGDPLDVLGSSGAQVAVDLTHPDAVLANVAACVARGVHVVVGTSGVDGLRLDEIRALLVDAPEVGVLVVPNFSIGAVLMMRFAAQAATYFESVEIIELHRAAKPDAPSGTAYRTAELVGEARRSAGVPSFEDATTHSLDGARGADVDGIRVHSVRLPGLLAHQEVLLGSPGEVLTIRHDSLDRSSFMPGVLLAIRAVGQRPGLSVGLDELLDLRSR